MEYPAPVNQLLQLGDVRNFEEHPPYLEIGISAEHIPDLLNLAVDMDLLEGDYQQPETWAPVHAWRMLGLLQAKAAVDRLLPLFHVLEGSYWTAAELPITFARIGPSAIPSLEEYLYNQKHPTFARAKVVRSLATMATHHREEKQNISEILTHQLQYYRRNEASLNGFITRSLVSLRAKEAAPLIEQAYRQRKISPRAAGGDLPDLLFKLGTISQDDRDTLRFPKGATPKTEDETQSKLDNGGKADG